MVGDMQRRDPVICSVCSWEHSGKQQVGCQETIVRCVSRKRWKVFAWLLLCAGALLKIVIRHFWKKSKSVNVPPTPGTLRLLWPRKQIQKKMLKYLGKMFRRRTRSRALIRKRTTTRYACNAGCGQAWGRSGAVRPKFILCSPEFCCARKFVYAVCFKQITKTNILPPTNVFPPNRYNLTAGLILPRCSYYGIRFNEVC